VVIGVRDQIPEAVIELAFGTAEFRVSLIRSWSRSD